MAVHVRADTQVGPVGRPGKGFLGTSLVLFAVFVVGMAVWGYQLSQGLVVTGMRNVVTWGLYIAFFMFFVGLSAGGLIVASAGTLFGVRRLAPLAPLAIWVSFVTVAAAAFFILPDMGHPERIANILRYPNWSSPLVWDVLVIVLYGAISIVYLWLHLRPALAERGSRLALSRGPLDEAARARLERLIRALAYLTLPLAVAIHSVTAWIFGLQIARPYWYSTILAPLFITSALVSGLGLLIVVALLARRRGYLSVPDATMSWLGGLLGVFIVADFFMLLADYLTALYPAASSVADPVNLLLSGQYRWVFLAELVPGVIALLLVFTARSRANIRLLGLAGLLAVVSIFFKRLALILAGLYQPIVADQPGIPLGPVTSTTPSGIPTVAPFSTVGIYAPTWVEYLVVIGIIAFWALLIVLGARLLPLRAYSENVEAGPVE